MADKIKGIQLKVVGVSFANGNGTSRQVIIQNMNMNSDIALVREKDNKFDRNAIAVITNNGEDQIGYIGKDYAAILADMMDNGGKSFTAKVCELDTYKGTWYLKVEVDEI